jgi:ATP/maltotriose-dependent transcriptional regulator MalT|tara:strand:- start:67 stop:459 length:393 start_codon:yes stop_codon:yes gene_type:complete
MAKTDYPNDYFAWYNDDKTISVVCQKTSSDSSEKTKEKYDTYAEATKADGIRIHYHSKYNEAKNVEDDLFKDVGLDSGMHCSVLDYVKSRMLEDQGDLQRAQYYRQRFTKMMREYPTRKSGVRSLAVPKL